MIKTQSFIDYNVFGDNATKTAPDSAKYSSGFIQADVLPAEWMNWAWYHNTKGITDLNAGLASTEQELNAVVEAGGGTPTATDNTQVVTAIQYLIAQAKAEAILAAHPKGSYYWSSVDTDPSELFGGTWTQIKDKFILAAGDTYTAGDTGGSATVTLTEQNLPAHSHSFSGSASHSHTTSSQSTSTTGGMSANSTGKWGTRVSNAASGGTGSNRYTPYSNGNISIDTTKQRTLHQRPDDGYYASCELYYSINVAHTHSYAHTHNTDSKTVTISGTTGKTGSTTAFNVMPPYEVAYCWKRIA